MSQPQVKQNNVFLELIFNIAIPSIILMKLSGDEYLGTVNALVIALMFPIIYGVYDFIKNKSLNLFSLLGFLSTLLTGGIGLFELDVEWLAIKEAAIPGVIGLVVFLSSFVGKPLIAKVLLNPALFRLDHLLAVSFAFSSVMNYALAKWIVTSPAGTVEFNEQLGEMTALSYPVIAIPSTIMLIAIMYYVIKSVTKVTGLKFEQIVNGE